MNHGAVAFPGTLLDWFAGQAMTAITISALSKNTKTGYTIDKPDFLECLSLDAYAHAEAMIKVKGRYYVDKMVEDHSPDAGKMVELEARNRELTERIKRLEEAGNDLVWWFCQGEPSQLSAVQSEALERWRDLRGRRSP